MIHSTRESERPVGNRQVCDKRLEFWTKLANFRDTLVEPDVINAMGRNIIVKIREESEKRRMRMHQREVNTKKWWMCAQVFWLDACMFRVHVLIFVTEKEREKKTCIDPLKSRKMWLHRMICASCLLYADTSVCPKPSVSLC